LAIVVLFGLSSSTLLNMIVVPSLFLRWAKSTPADGSDLEVEIAHLPDRAEHHRHPHRHSRATAAA